MKIFNDPFLDLDKTRHVNVSKKNPCFVSMTLKYLPWATQHWSISILFQNIQQHSIFFSLSFLVSVCYVTLFSMQYAYYSYWFIQSHSIFVEETMFHLNIQFFFSYISIYCYCYCWFCTSHHIWTLFLIFIFIRRKVHQHFDIVTWSRYWIFVSKQNWNILPHNLTVVYYRTKIAWDFYHQHLYNY